MKEKNGYRVDGMNGYRGTQNKKERQTKQAGIIENEEQIINVYEKLISTRSK